MPHLDLEGITTAAVMSYLGWLASSSTAPALSGPKTSTARRLKSGRSSGSSGGTGMKPSQRADLAIRPPNNTVMPRPLSAVRIGNQIYHDVVKIQSTITSSTTVITETGFQFNLSQHPQNGSLTALFDQWCVVMASVTVASQLPPGSTAVPGTLYSAIDFDNNTALGSIPLIEDFSSCRVQVMQPTSVHTRSVAPCSKTSLSGTASAGVQRSWIDSSQPSTPNYGVRVTIGITPAVQTYLVTTTVEFGFRNNI
jgi:hypothetical protein